MADEADRKTARRMTAAAPVIGLIPPLSHHASDLPITEWRPEPGDPRFEDVIPVYGVVARKP